MRPYQICVRCVMDTSDPWIVFSADGVCNHCAEFLEVRSGLINRNAGDTKPVADLMELVRRNGRGARYDCVVGVSGGVDSSYVAHLAATHGLRVLAVHLDNGWNSPIAVENINRLVSKLGLGYASCVLPWSDFKQVQVAFLKASIPEAETPTDVAIQRAIHDHASKNGVRTILSGGNLASEGILPVSWHYNARDTRYSYSCLKAGGCSRRHFRAMKFGLLREAYCRLVRGIKTVYPLNYLVYNKAEARSHLETQYGWRYYGSKHGESKFTKFIQTYYLPRKHGIDYRRATLSSEICLGHVGRAEALELLKEPPYVEAALEEELKYVAKKLGLSEGDLKEIVSAPPRWYRDFPNNEAMLGRLYDLYRFATGKRKTSNF